MRDNFVHAQYGISLKWVKLVTYDFIYERIMSHGT